MPTVHGVLAAEVERLTRAGWAPDQAWIDVEVLARHVLGWDRAALVAARHEPALAGLEPSLRALVDRRLTREPIAYITGTREFWGLDFEVSRDVLIPRPETELIVEEALRVFDGTAPSFIVDVGTGSGCLAVALAIEFPGARVVATDVSERAIATAARNAARHGVDRRIEFRRVDLLGDLTAPDLIVSNPPYVAREAAPSLAPDVRDHEPHVALFADDAGLSIVRTLIGQAAGRLSPGGWLVFEFGYGQDERVQELLDGRAWDQVRIREDYQGIPRVAVARRAGDERD